MHRTLSAASVLALAACATTSRVEVTDAGAALTLAPRPADCRIEFYRTKPPERPYDEVSTLHFSGRAGAEGAQEALRAKACELGADAVIVTRDYVVVSGGGPGVVVGYSVVNPTQGVMTGTAVSYPELRERHRLAHALRQEEKRAEFEKGVQAMVRPPELPAGYVPARTRRGANLLFMPGGDFKREIAAGQFIWVEPDSKRAYRRAVVSDGSTGYVDDDALELAPAEPQAPPAQTPQPPSAPERTNI
jgi:hypothetical protein